MKKTIISLAAITAAGLIAGCGSSGSGAQAARSAESAVATSSAVHSAEAKARKDIINPCLDASTGPANFISCVKNKVPKAERTTVGRCLAKAALDDKAYKASNSAGRNKFATADAPLCVSAVMP